MSHTLNHIPSLIAGQTLDARRFALDLAVRLHSRVEGPDDGVVVKTAEAFETFLTRAAPSPAPGGGTA